ncbi:MAG: DNA polymerase III subunit delta [Bdellovibrionales bacterium]|nr:DNA polymerase III subunit delta [Bdellovibrionales bacterium]
MLLDLRKLQQRLEKQAPAPIYLLLGDEAFLVHEAVQLLKHCSVDASTMDFNCDIFDAGETPASQVKDAAEMLPMMSARRLVVFRGVDNLKDKDWEILYQLFDNPVDSTTFVLTAESLDKRKKSYKKVADAAVVVELKRPYENQIVDWIDYLAYRAGLKVNREAAQLLKQFVGTNLTELNNEIAKLRDYIGQRKEVEPADVLQVVSQTRVDRIFDLTDAIGRRDKVHALHSLANLLEHGQSEVGVLAMISRHFRILSQLKDGQRGGLSGQRLATQAGIPQFLLNQYLEQIRHWDESKIQRTFNVLQDTDRALKSSSVPSHVWLENFVLKTCS